MSALVVQILSALVAVATSGVRACSVMAICIGFGVGGSVVRVADAGLAFGGTGEAVGGISVVVGGMDVSAAPGASSSALPQAVNRIENTKHRTSRMAN